MTIHITHGGFFVKVKDELPAKVIDKMKELKAKKFELKHVRMDNAGENIGEFKTYCKTNGVDVE